MPNRIIKESICSSDSLAKLSWFEQCLFFRLIVLADDYGTYDARPAIIKGRGFPLDNVTEKQIESALRQLVTAGIVSTYMVEEKPYLQLEGWSRHQQIRAKKRKYPSIEQADITCNQLISDDCNSPRNPIQSNPNPNPINNCAEPETVSVQDVVIDMPLLGGAFYQVSREQAEKWRTLYPSVNVMQELRNMVGWCDANPTKRKTKRGILRFINSWLERSQNSGANKRFQSNNESGSESIWADLEAL